MAKKRNNKTENPESHDFVVQIIALALLLAILIEAMFQEQKAKILHGMTDTKERAKWLKFLNYYETTWLETFGTELFSVFNESVRTNNNIETYHRHQLNQRKTGSTLTPSTFLCK